MHRIHRIQLLSIILLLICVSFLLGSICKYEIFVNEDTLGLKQVRLMFKRTLSQKPVLPLIHNQNKKNSAHYSWDIYQKSFDAKFDKVS